MLWGALFFLIPMLITCGGTKEGGLPKPGDLRPGYVIAATSTRPGVAVNAALVVSDVDVEGDLIVIVGTRVVTYDIAGGLPAIVDLTQPDLHVVEGSTDATSAIALFSRDGGATFREVELESADGMLLHPYPMPGVMIRGELVFVTVRSFYTVPNAGGGDTIYPFWRVAALDLETGRYTAVSDSNFHTTGELNGLVTAAWSEVDPRDPSYGNWYWMTLDPVTQIYTSGNQGFGPNDCSGFLSFTGRSWTGTCASSENVCEVTLDPIREETLHVGPCAAGADFPTSAFFVAPGSGGSIWLWQDGDLVRGDRVSGDIVIGTGTLDNGYSGGLHHRWDGLVSVIGTNGAQLSQVIGRTVHPVPLPSPCRDSARCEGVSPVAMRRNGKDEQLIVYSAWDQDTQAIIVGKERGLLLSTDSPPLDPQIPVPAPPLVLQCIASSVCFAVEPTIPRAVFEHCLFRWSSFRNTPGVPDPGLARFLAADPLDCMALATADPLGAEYGRSDHVNCSVSTCDGDLWVECQENGPIIFDCREANGSGCSSLQGYPGCHGDMDYLPGIGAYYCDEWGRAVRFGYVNDCPARGLVCDATAKCVLPSPLCETGAADRCQDGISVPCASVGSACGLRDLVDCTLLGVSCEVGWGCTPGSTLQPCWAEPDRCDGAILTFCSGTGQPQTVDCAALGLACGTDSLGLAACVHP